MTVLVFDFDGVIIDSVELKGEAFASIFAEEGWEFMERIKDFHREHAELDRYEKIREFARWKKEVMLPDVEQKLVDQFARIVMEKAADTPLIPGVREFIESHSSSPMYIVSKADSNEIKQILSARNIGQYFKDIYGMTWGKSDAILDIIGREGVPKKDVLYFGDSESDREAAVKAGVPFVEVVSTFPTI